MKNILSLPVIMLLALITNAQSNVGIGTANPVSKLDVIR